MNTRTCPRCGGTGRVPDARIKLTAADVQEILRRKREGEMQKSLAQEYGVSQSHISRLVNGRINGRI